MKYKYEIKWLLHGLSALLRNQPLHFLAELSGHACSNGLEWLCGHGPGQGLTLIPGGLSSPESRIQTDTYALHNARSEK